MSKKLIKHQTEYTYSKGKQAQRILRYAHGVITTEDSVYSIEEALEKYGMEVYNALSKDSWKYLLNKRLTNNK